MTSANPNQNSHCRVVNAEKLPAATGGPAALCDAVEHAVSVQAPGARYTAEVKVVSGSRLATTLTVNGRTLPEQRFAVMDRTLSASSIQHFADALAAEVAKASKD
jgi:hypothetical protein